MKFRRGLLDGFLIGSQKSHGKVISRVAEGLQHGELVKAVLFVPLDESLSPGHNSYAPAVVEHLSEG